MKGRIEVDRIEHRNTYNCDDEYIEEILRPLEKELKRRFFYSKYPDYYCKDCGKHMEFKLERSSYYVTAIFICDDCFRSEKRKYSGYI